MSKVITILSYRGGPEKSYILQKLANQLAKTKKVGCMDGAFQAPSFCTLFEVDPNEICHFLIDYLSALCPLQKAIFHKDNLSLLFSSPTPQRIIQFLRDKYSLPLFVQKLQELTKELSLDYLLIDTHPGITEENLLFLSLSHTALIVLDPPNEDVANTLAMIEIVRKMGVQNCFVIATQSSSNMRELEQSLGTPILNQEKIINFV